MDNIEEFLQQFPPLPEEDAPRTLYVHGMPQCVKETLTERNYAPTEINTLPRHDDEDHSKYILAKLQGANEGTIFLTGDTRRTLELEARAYGLLDSKRENLSLRVNVSGEDALAILGWKNSHHTLANNSTVVSAQLPKKPIKDKN